MGPRFAVTVAANKGSIAQDPTWKQLNLPVQSVMCDVQAGLIVKLGDVA